MPVVLLTLGLFLHLIPIRSPLSDRSHFSDSFIDSVRTKYQLPAMGVAVIADDTLSYIDATGVRKLGDPSLVHLRDAWHLGSCTKAVTAFIAARLIESGQLSLTTTVPKLFPELRGKLKPVYDSVTLQLLLEHRGGLSHDWPAEYTRRLFDTMQTPLTAQRVYLMRLMMSRDPEIQPNTKYNYSNAGYSIIASMLERATGKPYEALADSLVFRPLHMTSAGWGPTNDPFMVNNVWGHATKANGELVPIDNSRDGDNPALYNPVGRLHLSLEDWSKFVRQFLPGTKGHLLADSTVAKIDALPSKGSYDYGWIHMRRGWAGGIAMNHGGTNTMNFADIWVAPEKHFAVMITTNAYNPSAEQACDQIAARAIESYVK